MLTKVCGLKETKIINCCETNNVNFFGLIFYEKSPRYISLNKAKKLIDFSKKKQVKPVAVFYNENIEKVKSYIEYLNLKFIQLHGEEDDQYLGQIKKNFNINIIKSLSVRSKIDLKKVQNYQNNDYFLLDYKPKKNDLPGGNAKQFDWSILSDFSIEKPWFISGGININNINKIKNYSNPDGIDLSSGVEDVPGIKNERLINNLFKKFYND